jgi:serine/threonine-protein phosphatase 2A regulatory subunit A
MTKLAEVLSQQQIEENYIPVIRRLSGGSWFTNRMSACGLYASAYQKATPPVQEELRTLYKQFCQDDMPMVRRAAASHLGVSALLHLSNCLRSRFTYSSLIDGIVSFST